MNYCIATQQGYDSLRKRDYTNEFFWDLHNIVSKVRMITKKEHLINMLNTNFCLLRISLHIQI